MAEHPLISSVMPEFADELHRLLIQMEEPNLAAQVADLMIFERCRCGDDFCSTFYVQPAPNGAYVGELETMDLDADHGMVLIDVVDGSIAAVEVLYRDDIRAAIDKILPLVDGSPR